MRKWCFAKNTKIGKNLWQGRKLANFIDRYKNWQKTLAVAKIGKKHYNMANLAKNIGKT